MATTEGLLAVFLVVGTVRETGPCPSRMTHILGGGQGDSEKGKQGHFTWVLKAASELESERKGRGNLAGGRGLSEPALGCAVNERIVQAGERACGRDAGAGWRARLSTLAEGGHLCLGDNVPSTSESLNSSFIFWSANSHWGLSGPDSEFRTDRWLEVISGFSSNSLDSQEGRSNPAPICMVALYIFAY